MVTVIMVMMMKVTGDSLRCDVVVLLCIALRHILAVWSGIVSYIYYMLHELTYEVRSRGLIVILPSIYLI